jgi:predicted nucleotidyltransferase
METLKNQLFSTPLLRVFEFLLERPDLELCDAEIIAQVGGAKRAAVHLALTRLGRMGIVKRTQRERRCYNTLELRNAWIPFFKIASDILSIAPLVEHLKQHVSRIVLFGSRAEGTSRHDSDYDLAIVSQEPDAVRRVADDFELAERLQLIVKTPQEMLELDAREPALATRIRKGVVLWES